MSDVEKTGFISKFVQLVIGDKKRWRAYKARVKQLPDNYRAAVDGIERYTMYVGPADGDKAMTMFEDLADLFEQAAADGTPIRDIVGDDPIEFVETFVANYGGGGWISREQKKLSDAITLAEGEDGEAQA